MAAQRLCPIDGQTLDWHMKVYNNTRAGHHLGTSTPIFFGDRVGCGFISPIDRENYRPKENDGKR